MALPGISNANEFYSAHYLDSVLTGDIKKVRERWNNDAKAELEENPLAEVNTPEQRFKALRKPWQKMREAELGIKNDPAERLRLQRELFFQPLCEALGYGFSPKAEPVLIGEQAYQIPLLGEVRNGKDEPLLWLVECFNPNDEEIDPLELTISTRWGCQIDDPSLGIVVGADDEANKETWEELISERVFGQDIPPRWVLAVSRDQLLLIDRQKWAASRLLRFELDTLLGNNNTDALLAVATLLHREHTCPTDGGTPYLDELDENSHKHAYEVSGDLKYALRKSIELIGNEAIHWRKEQREGVFKGKTDADQLTLECLRYMYRLLFLFYIESRPDLGYAPMGSDVYRLGYSLDSLREMDTAELNDEQDVEGYYISDSLDRLFQMIWEGYPKREDPTEQLLLSETEETFHDSFRLTPLRAHLFDPQRLHMLTRVRFRNVVLREVIELMSLGHPDRRSKRKSGFGQVSYSQLGINQLGAVYEALLSFRGFFAEEDLFEVQPAPKKGKAAKTSDDDDFDGDDDEGNSAKASGAAHDELKVGHFVTAEQLKAYKSEEIVPDPGTGNPKCYPKGSFIYRLAGRDREKSASYYTPESLTQCLVKYALKELLPGKTAADILELKVCEPAMGSAAFLNEVVNQLAQAYLELRQKEKRQTIPHEQFATELQKVKMRLADQNVFGVDLNPVAVELAEVSLWLNSIFTPEKGRAFVPWFSQQLVCGNSLIGARRQIYRVNQLPTSTSRSAKPRKLWHEHAPEELAWDAQLPDDGIFHFLLPDPGMAAYSDKVIKQLEPEAIERCKKWNKAFVGDVFTESQIAHLQRLSKLVDSLWKDWATQQQQLRERTTDPLPVWEDPTGAEEGDWTPLLLKDRIQEQEVLGRDVANTNARLRLKWAMDYWVALWFWPISEAQSLPSRDTWLLELSMILGDLEQGINPELGQGNLFADTQPKQLAADFSDRHGFVDVEKLKTEFDRLFKVETIANRIHPLHWDLEFADLLENGGFDLVVGNPPWLKITWEEKGIIGDYDPLSIIRDESAGQLAKRRDQIVSQNTSLYDAYIQEYESQTANQRFIGSPQNYFVLKNISPNLYKCFLPLSWRITASNSTCGFLHPEGVYDDPKGGELRSEIYQRVRYHFQFSNELKLFPIGHRAKFSLNIFSTPREPEFVSISNLFTPKTINTCLASNIKDKNEGIRADDGRWNTAGYPSRVIHIDKTSLSLFANLFDGNTEYKKARLPAIFSSRLVNVLKKISEYPEKLTSLSDKYQSTLMWSETSSIKIDKTMEKSTFFPASSKELIISGPHFMTATPLYQTPRRVCDTHRSYDYVDIENIPDEYLPRTNFRLLGGSEDISQKNIAIKWDNSLEYNQALRVIARKRIDPTHERTLKAALMPSGSHHINSCISFAFKDKIDFIRFAAAAFSLPCDFLVKSTGKADFLEDLASTLPMVDPCKHITARVLGLNCLSKDFGLIWEACWENELQTCKWSSEDERLDSDYFEHLSKNWRPENRLSTNFQRRLALIEIDVLISQKIGLTIEDLLAIYRIQFPVLNQYEKDTWYDRNGKIVFTNNKGLAGVGFPRKGSGRGNSKTTGWEDIADMTTGTVSRTIIDDTLPGGPVERTITYEAPFDRCDRVEDYKMAWEFFEREGIN